MKKKILKITIVMLLLVWVYTTIANALSFTVSMTPSSTTIPESTEFIVTVKVTNIELGDNENGLNTLTGYLDYDTNVFEEITESSIEGMSGWTPSYEADNNGKISLNKSTFVESEENVFNVTFKTKAETSGEVGQIQFKNIVATNSANDVTASDISVTIEVKESESSGNTTNNTSNNAIISANTPDNNAVNEPINIVNSTVPSYVNQESNSSEEDIPYTGVENVVIYAIGIVVVIAIISYIKFQRIDKDIK